jgi:DNA polymerase, archaea type
MTIIDVVYSEDSQRHLKLIKTLNGKKIVEEIDAPEPYFMALPINLEQAKKDILGLIYEFKDKQTKVIRVEQVTKNFQNKETKFLKIIVNFPREVPVIRETIRNLPSVEEVFEADIPYVFRSILDNKIELYKDFKPKILAFDIETTSDGSFPDPLTDKIVSISYYSKNFEKVTIIRDFKRKHKYINSVASEKELLKDFQETINQFEPDILTGYNSDIFDMWFIKERAAKNKIKLTLAPLNNEPIYTRGARNAKPVKINGITHLDTYIFIRNALAPRLKTNSLSLNNVAEEMLGQKKLELGVLPHEAWLDNSDENMNRFAEYNLLDSKLTYLLAEKILPIALQFSRFTGLPLFDVTRMRYGRLVEQFIIKSAIEQNRIIENRPSNDEIMRRRSTQAEGAFVYQPTPGVYKNVRVFDFSSLYPTILIAHNIDKYTMKSEGSDKEKINLPDKTIFFDKSKQGFLPELIERIITRRFEVKKLMKNCEKDSDKYRTLDAESYGLKILANSFYGYLAFFGARWYSLDCARSITAMGRKYIHDTIDLAEKHNIKVIYGDTDSVFLIDSEAMDKFKDEANESLPTPMELEEEGLFKSGVFLEKKGSGAGAKKRYALLDQNDKMIIKGLEARRGDWSKLAQKAQVETLKIILTEVDGKPALEKIQNIISDIRSKKINMEDLILTNRLTKQIHEYKTKGPQVAAGELLAQTGIKVGAGTIVKYVITKGGSKRIRDRVKLPEDTKIEEIDEDYYINNQLIGATYKILELFGYSEEQIKNLNTGLDQWF